MRQSKWQPTIDPGTEHYLKTNRIRIFTLLNYFIYSVLLSPQCYVKSLLPSRNIISTSKTIPWHSPSHSPQVSRIFLHVQDLSSRQDLHLSFFRPSSFYWNHFLLGTWHFITSSSLQNSRALFSPVSVIWSTTHMVSLVTGGSVPCLCINCRIQDVPLLFNPGVTKICYHPVPVAVSIWLLGWAWWSRSSALDILPNTHKPKYLSPVAFTI